MTKYSAKQILKKTIEFVLPFKGIFFLALVLNFVFSALSVLSISLIKPIFEIIFEGNISADNLPTNNGILENIKINFFAKISELISSGGADLHTSLLRASIIIFIVFLLKNIVKYIGNVINTKFQENIIKFIRDTFFAKINSLSIDFFNKNKLGNLMSIITNDISIINSATIDSFSVIFRDSFQIILYILLLFSISERLTLITFFAGGFILIIIRIATKYLRKYATRIQQAMADFTTTMSEIISGIRIVKSFNGEFNAVNRFKNDTNYFVKSAIKHQKISALVPVLSELSAIGALCVVLLQGGNLILNGTLTPSDLMLFLFSVFSVMSPIISVTNAITQFQRGYVAASRVFNVLDEKPSVVDGNITNIKFEKSIEFHNVTFKYIDNIVLDKINLKIEKGKQIAFVGSSGSGKSTMLDLLIRFYDPIEGDIFVDGVNLRDIRTKDYRELFGVVSQENILFNDTIKNNIAFGWNKFTDSDLEIAAKTSNSFNFIMKMTDGFDTYIGDRGVNISGGERQRIAIARALLRKPPVLIFDEATSALDNESEKIVQNAINNSLSDKTAIIVAHRLSTIINCDTIVVFDKGHIVEEGTHSELLAMDGYYAHLYNVSSK
ncbi:MAG: ABC transporter ATP-binding protein/permease [Ignavibacteria bacterium]|jgi:subfamily B ATP-binding cassette protein MsbA|nr:ABC transporter ATP-binding protein/permease [Ignavibacteria bacterium]